MFHSTRPTLVHGLPLRPKIDAHMNMWGKLFPKRGQLEWSCSVLDKGICDLLVVENDHDVPNLVPYPYVGMDWKGCVNIQLLRMSHWMIEVILSLWVNPWRWVTLLGQMWSWKIKILPIYGIETLESHISLWISICSKKIFCGDLCFCCSDIFSKSINVI